MSILVKYRWLVLEVLVVLGVGGCEQPPAKHAEMPPPEVEVSKPLVMDVTDYEETTGRTEAIESVQVRARVGGYLTRINFKDGDDVKAGQVLFEIDPQPYQAQFDQDQADLANKNATVEKTKKLFTRTVALRPSGGSTQEDEDNHVGDHNIAKAAVGQAEAKLRASKLMLDWTLVRAPISGRASRKLITEGNLVTADNTTLTTIVSLESMYVYFFVDERTLLRIRTGGRFAPADKNAPAVKSVTVDMGLAYEEGYSLKGVINFEDNTVDPGTGTKLLRAELKNFKAADGHWLLSPGLFARIRVPIGQPKPAVLVADRALSTDQGKKFVYVVVDKADPKTGKVGPTVERRYIQAGGLHGGLREILGKNGNQTLPANQTVSPDERVVVSGLQRIQPGFPVQPKDVPMPAAN
jgi:RND family efflux transporter MFP subunit